MNGQIREFPDNVKGKIAIYRFSVLLITLLAVGFRIAALAMNYSPESGYFDTGAFLPAASNALIVIGALWGLSAALLIPKNTLPKTRGPVTNREYFALIYAAFIMVADGGYRIYTVLREKKALADEPLFAKEQAVVIVTVLTAICVVSAFGSAACFVLRAVEKGDGNLNGILGMFPVLRVVCGLALPYFDWTVHMNSPVKLMLEFTMIALIPYFLADDRFYLPGDHAKPELWYGVSLASEILCAVCGVSGIYVYFSGAEMNGELLIEAFCALTLFFVIIAGQSSYLREVPRGEADDPSGPADGEAPENADSEANEVSGEKETGEDDKTTEEKETEEAKQAAEEDGSAGEDARVSDGESQG